MSASCPPTLPYTSPWPRSPGPSSSCWWRSAARTCACGVPCSVAERVAGAAAVDRVDLERRPVHPAHQLEVTREQLADERLGADFRGRPAAQLEEARVDHRPLRVRREPALD